MGWRDDWISIRSGNSSLGLANLTSDFEADKSNASTALDLVAADMWLRRYNEAETICAIAEAAQPAGMSTSCFPIQRGTAQWCLGRYSEAVITWESTARVSYADAAGANVHFLLLIAANGLRHRTLPSVVREAIAKKRTDNRIHHNWPGPIALYLLGIYGASMAIQEAADSRVNRWQFRFFQLLKEFSLRGDNGCLLNELELLWSQVEAETDLETFVDFARLPEVYMARELREVISEVRSPN